jgi:ABC-2 type transport system permease protein
MKDALLRTVYGRSLWDQRRALLGWSVALVLLSLVMVSFYPTIRDQAAEFERLIESYPPAMRALFGDFSDFATPAGYLRAELFSTMLPLLLLVYAIGRGSDLIAGEEGRGQLETLLSHPLTRRRVVLEKAAALATGLVLLATASFVALAVGVLLVRMDMPMGNLAAGYLHLVLLALLFGLLALALGALRGRRGAAVGIAAGAGVATFLLDSLANLVEWMEPSQWLSPWQYYVGGEPLKLGPDWLGLAVLSAASAALLGLAVRALERRDVGT